MLKKKLRLQPCQIECLILVQTETMAKCNKIDFTVDNMSKNTYINLSL